MDTDAKLFLDQPVAFVETAASRVAYRKFGQGPNLVFLHGWPLWSFTFRRLIPYLSPHFTCYLIDVPGGGDTAWTEATDFTWPGQAATVKEVLEKLGVERYFVLGQDSGAMIARQLVQIDAARAQRLVMTNTEMPAHRPPWIPLYRALMFVPGTNFFLRLLLRSRAFLRSRLGFGNSFMDVERLDGDFREHVIEPLIRSTRRMAGHNRFLRGWSWELLDGMREEHARITMPVLLIWGEDDPTFPVGDAERMREQFPNAELKRVPSAKLFVQEDQPELLSQLVIDFLGAKPPEARRTGEENTMDTERWTDALLDSMGNTADPVTDQIVAEVIAGGGYPAAEKLLIFLRDWLAQPTDDMLPCVRDYFSAPVVMPAWYDPVKIKRAEKLFASYGPLQVACIALYGVPRFFADGQGANSFALAKLFNPDVVKSRMVEVVQMVIWTGSPGGFIPSPVKGNGILTIQKLRMIHSVLRVFLTPQWTWACKPICQEDLAYAMTGFAFAVLDGLEKLGVQQSPEDKEAVFHAWKVFGQIIGICEELMPSSMDEARQELAIIEKRRVCPSVDGSVLTAELIETGSNWMPPGFKEVIPALVRYLCGDEVADIVNVPHVKLSILGDIVRLVDREATTETGQAIFHFLGRHFGPIIVKKLATEQRRGSRGAFIIPDELRQAWQLDVNIH